jgi:hypothetical protein
MWMPGEGFGEMRELRATSSMAFDLNDRECIEKADGSLESSTRFQETKVGRTCRSSCAAMGRARLLSFERAAARVIHGSAGSGGILRLPRAIGPDAAGRG